MNNANNFARVAVVGRRRSPELAAPLTTLVTFLLDRQVSVCVEEETARLIPAIRLPVYPPDQIGQHCDLVIVVGGDGTMLAFACRLAPFKVPLLGVNQGRLGFLTDIPQAQMEAMVGAILDGHYTREERFMLMAQVFRGEATQSLEGAAKSPQDQTKQLADAGGGIRDSVELHAVNDIVLGRSHTNSLVDFSIEVDGNYAYNLRADGIIVATPTGSTAYALSAGGPILAPSLAAFVIVPVAPYGLTHRPIVVPTEAQLRVTIRRCETIYLYADGQTQVPIHEGEQVNIHVSPHRAHLVHPAHHDYFDALRHKLHWSQTPERMQLPHDTGRQFSQKNNE